VVLGNNEYRIDLSDVEENKIIPTHNAWIEEQFIHDLANPQKYAHDHELSKQSIGEHSNDAERKHPTYRVTKHIIVRGRDLIFYGFIRCEMHDCMRCDLYRDKRGCHDVGYFFHLRTMFLGRGPTIA
jgi:hypothetical protein